MDDNNSYMLKDNGHLNQRPQMYAKHGGGRDAQVPGRENPGPGSYEVNKSSFYD